MDPCRGRMLPESPGEQAGNPQSRVELFPRPSGIAVSESGCTEEDGLMFTQYIQSLGYSSVSEAQEADPEGIPMNPGY